ncbi:Cathepsin L1 [Tupaia chinensis]|uniref:Cathepsin L1 n=1 Tax=Tupaia chinensis TaxID=246437 RepID=L8YG29_TUPCH|nr:Cathepsin L1 [Tupaia chinensis]
MIEQHSLEYSEGKHTFTMPMNAFGDMTDEEFRQMTNDFQKEKHKKGTVSHQSLPEVPESVDWGERLCDFCEESGMMESESDLHLHWKSRRN